MTVVGRALDREECLRMARLMEHMADKSRELADEYEQNAEVWRERAEAYA